MIWLLIASSLCLVAVWGLTLTLHWPSLLALCATGLILALVGTIFAVRLILRKRRGRALERELAEQGEQHVRRVRPDQRPEVLALQRQMSTAIGALKSSRLGGGGSSALYALPWFAVMGPSATGKTTLLLNSGLSFRSPDGTQRKVQGVAGTRNCDWWFSEQAILLDTAGRLATEDKDEPEWLAFLALLKRNRPHRPLDGVLITVSATDLLGVKGEELESKARKLRARLNELIGQLEMVLPVYLVVTKADLIAGFSEFWSDLGDDEAAQIWGATFDPHDSRLDRPGEAVKSEMDGLLSVLHARTLRRLQQKESSDRLARIIQFPIEFQGIRRPLARFTSELFGKSDYGETPLLRGFYFTSGTQSGTPVDRVLAGAMQKSRTARSVNPAATRLESPTAGHSFFLLELFKNVVFGDLGLATRSRSKVQRLMRHQMVIAAAAILAAVAAAIPATLSYLNNRSWIEESDAIFSTARNDSGNAAAQGQSLDRLLEHWLALEQEAERSSVSYWWGPYTTPHLAAVARRTYMEHLKAVVDGPVQKQLTQRVDSVANLPELDDENFRVGHDELKLYLELCTPPRLEKRWATKALLKIWTRAEQRGAIPPSRNRAQHVEQYVREYSNRAAWAWRENGIAVTRARGRLRSQKIEEISYSKIIKVASAAPPIRPSDIFYGPSAQYISAESNVQVPGAFTKLGWEQVRAALDSGSHRITFDSWVLGYSDDARAPWSKDSLRTRYFTEYARHWENFFLELDTRSPKNLRDAIQEMSVLGKIDGPFTRLSRSLADNVQLELEAPKTELEKLVEKGKDVAEDKLAKLAKQPSKSAGDSSRQLSPVELHFRRLLRFSFGETVPDSASTELPPSSLNQYLEELRNLEVALKQVLAAHLDPSAYKGELQRTVSSVERLLGGLSQTERFIMDRLLVKPLRGSVAVVAGAEARELNELWKIEVFSDLSRIRDQYPFASRSQDEVPLADFSNFFRPESGAFWKFYNTHLRMWFSNSGSKFTMNAKARQAGYSTALASCLSRVRQITDGVFFASRDTPSIAFGVAMEAPGGGVSESVLTLDGQELHYRNEPVRWRTIHWPGKGTTKGAMVRVRGQEEGNPFQDKFQRYGDFAFFRLLAAGRAKKVSPRSVDLEASWTLHQTKVVMRFRPPTANHPFRSGFFQRLNCPASILKPRKGRR